MSTPESRIKARDNAVHLGQIQKKIDKFFRKDIVLLVIVVACLLGMAWLNSH